MVLVAYNAHYSSKYLQTFTLHHISTNCRSINKGTIPEVLANTAFIFPTAPSFLVRSRPSAVSGLAQPLLLSQSRKGAFARESLPCNLLSCQTQEAPVCGATEAVLSQAAHLQGPHTSPAATGTYCWLAAAHTSHEQETVGLCFMRDSARARLIRPCNETPAKVLFGVSVLPQVCPGSELRALPIQGEGAYARWDATTAPGFHLPGRGGARPDKVSASPPQPGPSELEEG